MINYRKKLFFFFFSSTEARIRLKDAGHPSVDPSRWTPDRYGCTSSINMRNHVAVWKPQTPASGGLDICIKCRRVLGFRKRFLSTWLKYKDSFFFVESG